MAETILTIPDVGKLLGEASSVKNILIMQGVAIFAAVISGLSTWLSIFYLALSARGFH